MKGSDSMAQQVGFTSGNFGLPNLQAVSATQQITTPVMFELSISGLASLYQYGQAVFLGNRQQAMQAILMANGQRASTISMVSQYLQLPVAQQITNFESKIYSPQFYQANSDMQTALNAISSGEQLQDVFNETILQNKMNAFISNLANQGWQVQYFQIDQISIINGPGGDIPTTYQFIDGATWLVSAVPLSNATPIQFEQNSTGTSQYGGPVATIIIISLVIALTIVFIIGAQTIIPVIENAAIATMNSLSKNAPAVTSTILSVGELALIGFGGLALLILIMSGNKKNNNNKEEGKT